jgi:phosphopantetheinyl transferase
MVGNDIVDIALAKEESNWQRPRYLNKIFTLEEQVLIRLSKAPTLMVWRLWSMKEAAYKLYTQLYPSRFFNPKSFQCTLNNGGLVTFRTFKAVVKTKVSSNYILSEARLEQHRISSTIVNLKSSIPMAQSNLLRECLLAEASKALGCEPNDIHLIKEKYGIPTIRYKSTSFSVSMTHHGQFGAIAFSI